jgi:predicted TIM-barrel fold metal-dependent hydrolase
MDSCGISKLVFLNVLPTVEMIEAGLRKRAPETEEARRDAEAELRSEMADRIRRQNAWACEVGATFDRLVPFVGVQPLLGSEDAAAEVRLGHESGAKGVKIQPGMNAFFPADRALWPMYETAQELGLPILTDSGTYGHPTPDGGHYGEPFNFVEVLESFPRLTLVQAHFASAYWDQRIELAQRYPNLFFDVSGGFGAPDLIVRDEHRALAEDDAVRVLRRVGVDRFLFGTDGPSVMPQPYIEQVLRLGLTDDEQRLILSENAKRLYRI